MSAWPWKDARARRPTASRRSISACVSRASAPVMSSPSNSNLRLASAFLQEEPQQTCTFSGRLFSCCTLYTSPNRSKQEFVQIYTRCIQWFRAAIALKYKHRLDGNELKCCQPQHVQPCETT